MTRKTKLRIKVPIPPFGTEKAKIVIENDWGPKKQQSDEEVIFDYIDFCKELYTPETKPLPFVTITQIATAYDQCIDTLSDLYCSPTTSPTGQAPSGTPPPKVSNFIVDKDNIYLADEYELSWDLQGIGIYRLYMRVKGNNKLLKEENFTETTQQQKKYSGVLIDSLLTSDIENVEFVLTVFDKDAQPIENGVLTKTIQILRLPEVIVPPRKEFVKDNDPSDAKKEIYYLSQNVADRNLTLSDYQISNLNIDKRKFNSKDLARENMGSFWILNDEETKLVSAFNKNTSGKVIDLDLSQVNTRNSIRPATGERYSATFGGLVEAVPFDINTDLISGDQVLFWLNNSFPSNSVTDILYSYQKPYTKKEALQMLEKPSNFSMIEEKSEYNFYKRKYEEIHFDIDENLLPNMYFISLNRDAIDKRGTATKEDDFELDPDIGSLVSVNDSANSQASKQPIDIKMYYDFSSIIEKLDGFSSICNASFFV